jgi:APA family basic amino acid/polyamine antiporter
VHRLQAGDLAQVTEARSDALKPGVGLTGVVMFGAGSAIGVSIFSVLQPAAAVAGSDLLLAIVIAALPMILFATVYAWLASALPVSGASYEWPRRFLGPFTGFAIAWLRILSNVGALVVLAQVLVSYVDMVFPLPLKPVMALTITAVFLLNYRGVGVAAGAQVVLMLLLIAVLAVFVGSGLQQASAATLGSLGDGWAALAAVPLMISLFLGIESAVEIGEEVRSPTRTIPLGIAIAIALTALIYAAVALTALGLVGPAALAASKAPLLDAARVPLGDWAVPLIVGAATVSILKTMNAIALGFSRSLFAMGRTGAFPAAIAALHPRYGTPHHALLFGWAMAMLGLLLPDSLIFLLLAVNIPTMLKYLAVSLCAVRASGDGEVAERAALRLRLPTVRTVGWLAATAAIAVIVAGLGADVRPYLLVLGWFVVGCCYWIVSRRRIALHA